FFTIAPQPSTCVPGDISTYNPVYIPVMSNPNRLASGNFSAECDVVALYNTGRQNTGRVRQAGVDVIGSYSWNTNFGHGNLSGAISSIISLERAFLPDQELEDVLDTIGFQVGDRGRIKLGWT